MRRVVLACLAVALVGCPSEEPDPGASPLPLSTEPAEVPADGLTLEGVLHLPSRGDGEAVPGVVLVHGSGPNSRDEASEGQLNMSYQGAEVRAFVDIAERLQAMGVAVLRYDKRSCGTFNGLCENDYPSPSPDLLVSDFIDDAVAAGEWLAAHDAVDAGAVYVIGHSQGAASMPEILARSTTYAGGVSLAGNWRPIDVLLRYQLDFSVQLLEELGQSQAQIDQATANLRAMVEDVEAERAGTFSGTSIAGLPVAFWQDWMAIGDARPARVAAETRPMMALNGAYDWNIPADPELDLWADAGVETIELNCVTHSLNCVTNPDWMTLQPGDFGSEVAPSVLGALGGWVLAR